MIRRSLRVAAALLAVALSPCGHRTASAGPPSSTLYTWSPLAGSGWYETDPINGSPQIDFRTGDASLQITWYDPTSIYRYSDSITVYSGVAGVPVTAAVINSFGPGSEPGPYEGSLEMTGTASYGTTVDVIFEGAPGSLTASGWPSSLSSLAAYPVEVTVTGGYHIGYAFTVSSVPEPSSALMFAVGLIGMAVACARRSRRR